MAADLQSIPALLAAWVVGGLLAMAGGLTFAETGLDVPAHRRHVRLPRGGVRPGVGVPLRLGRRCSSCSPAASRASPSALPSTSATSCRRWARPASCGPPGRCTVSAGGVVAAVSILAIGWINLVGVSTVNRVQGALTVAKIAGIAAIPLLAIALHPVTPELVAGAAAGGASAGRVRRGDDRGHVGVRRLELPGDVGRRDPRCGAHRAARLHPRARSR